MLILTKEHIQSVFTMKDAIEADKEAFRIFSESKSITPLRTHLKAENGGSMLFMPSYVSEIASGGIKIVSVFPKNAEKNLPVTPAKVLLLDTETGDVICLLDGTYVTELRTGAATGAAFDLLARKEARIGALIGAGGQAKSQLEAMITARNLEEVRVYERNKQKGMEFVEKMNEIFSTTITFVETGDLAVTNADVIAFATTATAPVFDGSKVKQGATISGVGSYTPEMQEIDPLLFEKAGKIFFDSQEAVLAEAGDVIKPLADGRITEKNFTGELGDVVNGKLLGRENNEELIIFKTVGIAVQDVVTAKRIYEKAVEKGIGLEIKF